MSSSPSPVLVSVDGPAGRADLALSPDVPIGEVLPQILDHVSLQAGIPGGGDWVLGATGDAPLAPQLTLEQCGVLDGAQLYVKRAAELSATKSAPRAGAMVSAGGTPPAPSTPRARWDLPLWIAPALTAIGLAIGLTGLVSAARQAMLGRGAAFLVSVLVLTGCVIWWLGLLGQVATLPGLGFLARIGQPIGLGDDARRADRRPDSGGSHENRPPVEMPAHRTDRRARAMRINQLVEDLVFDLGQIMAGDRPAFERVDRGLAARLIAQVTPRLAPGERLIPEFGGEVDVDITWPPSATSPVSVDVVINDRSILEVGGRRVPLQPRRVRLVLAIDADAERILEVTTDPPLWPQR